jgi:hypothetical protein
MMRAALMPGPSDADREAALLLMAKAVRALCLNDECLYE